MVGVVHELIDDEQGEMHKWSPADFCCFDLDFLTLSIECKCRTMVEWSQFITFASSRVHWRGSLWINEFKRSSSNPESLSESGVWLMSKRPSLKRENYFLLPCSLRRHFPCTRCKYFWPPTLLSLLYWTQREEHVGYVPIFPLGTPFSSVHGSTYYVQMKNINM